MRVILLVLLLLFSAVLLWFKIDYSPLEQQFSADVSAAEESLVKQSSGVFTAADFSHLPPIIQRYLEQNEYLGKPKMCAISLEFEDVVFRRDMASPPMRMAYTQTNFVDKPTRLALMKSSLFGIPFQGYDTYLAGKGGMKGVIGKLITLFHQTGPEMDQAALVTFLSECLLVPSTLLQEYNEFEVISEYQVRATIRDGETAVSGVFEFNDKAEMISFTTDERGATMPDGSMQRIRWSIDCADYQQNEHGIRFPRHISATWHYPEGDLVYFEGNISHITYQ